MKIAVLWDVMLDKFTFWNVNRLNPESPAQLMNVQSEEFRLWWAANVAANIASLDSWVVLIWLVWDDYHGKQFKLLCDNFNITFVNIKNTFPTITKQRFIENTYRQQLLRVDYEEKMWLEYSQITEIIDSLKQNEIDLLIVSDYNKWLISKDLIDRIFELWIKVLVDCKPVNTYMFKWAYLIKPNFKEFLQIMLWKIENTDEDVELHWKEFVNQYNTNLVVTRWSKWATLITKDSIVNHLHTEAQQVFDVTWAWDTFLAAISFALSKWYNLVDAVQLWNKASWIVVGEVGTAVVSREDLWIK